MLESLNTIAVVIAGSVPVLTTVLLIARWGLTQFTIKHTVFKKQTLHEKSRFIKIKILTSLALKEFMFYFYLHRQ